MNEEKKVKISVVIPVYNTPENVVRQCIESILRQTFTDFELILVDDGSTNNNLSVLYEYKNLDSRVRVLTQSNRYAGTARNNGINHSRGDYLCFFDSDDYCEPDYLKVMYDLAIANQSDVVICEENFFDIDLNVIIPKTVSDDKKKESYDWSNFNVTDVPEEIFQISNGWPWDKLFRKSFIIENDLFFAPSRTANDGFFVFMAMNLANVISKTDRRLVTHRMGGGSSLSNTRESTWHDGVSMLFDLKASLMSKGIYSRVEKSFLNYSLYYIFWALENMSLGEGKRKLYSAIGGEIKSVFQFEEKPVSFYMDSSLYYRYLFAQKNDIEKYIDTYELSFPYGVIPRGSKIVMYAAGKFGKMFYRELQKNMYAEIVLWIDQRFAGRNLKNSDGVRLGGMDCILNEEYDYVVFTLSSRSVFEEIYELLIRNGVPAEKIVFAGKG